jgi:hypothetical protein
MWRLWWGKGMRRKKVILIRDSMGNGKNQMMKKVAVFVRKILMFPGNQADGGLECFLQKRKFY